MIPPDSPVIAISDLRSWADAVISLEPTGPLPTRVVLVPSEAHAHALRVEFASRAPRALMGTRFLTLPAAARWVLDHAGVVCHGGEDERRPLRVRKVLGEGLPLRYYRADALRSVCGDDAAITTARLRDATGPLAAFRELKA